MLVVDLDRKHGVDGFATLEGVEAELGTLPLTLCATTPSGGEHRFFGLTTAYEIRNSASKVGSLKAPGIDVRGEGGYVLLAPSSIEGVPYRWTTRHAVADLPAAWVNALAQESKVRETPAREMPMPAGDGARVAAWCLAALRRESQDVADAPQGTRNDRLWRAAAALGGLVHARAFDANDVRRALTWACSTWKTRTPHKDQKTIESGLAFGISHPRPVEVSSSDQGQAAAVGWSR